MTMPGENSRMQEPTHVHRPGKEPITQSLQESEQGRRSVQSRIVPRRKKGDVSNDMCFEDEDHIVLNSSETSLLSAQECAGKVSCLNLFGEKPYRDIVSM